MTRHAHFAISPVFNLLYFAATQGVLRILTGFIVEATSRGIGKCVARLQTAGRQVLRRIAAIANRHFLPKTCPGISQRSSVCGHRNGRPEQCAGANQGKTAKHRRDDDHVELLFMTMTQCFGPKMGDGLQRHLPAIAGARTVASNHLAICAQSHPTRWLRSVAPKRMPAIFSVLLRCSLTLWRQALAADPDVSRSPVPVP